jgi:hypothetical protein
MKPNATRQATKRMKRSSRKERKGRKEKTVNSKHEIRSSKQYRMTKTTIFQQIRSDFDFWVSNFEIVSDFGAPVKTGKVL